MQQETTADEVAAVHAELVQLARELVAGGREAQGGPSFAQHSVLSFVPLRAGYPLHLTDQGTAVLASADRRRLDEVRARVDGWSPTEISQFASILRRFRTAQAPTPLAEPFQRDGDDAHA